MREARSSWGANAGKGVWICGVLRADPVDRPNGGREAVRRRLERPSAKQGRSVLAVRISRGATRSIPFAALLASPKLSAMDRPGWRPIRPCDVRGRPEPVVVACSRMKRASKRQKQQQRLETAKRRGDAKAILREAVRLLRSGETSRASGLATVAAASARDEATARAAREFRAVVLFRLAMEAPDAGKIAALDEALTADPESARVRFHRAIALLRERRFEDAAADLDAVAALEPGRPGLAALRSLAALAVDPTAPLLQPTAPDAQMLQAVAGIVGSGKAPKGSPEPWATLSKFSSGRRADREALATLSAGTGSRIAAILRYYSGVARVKAGDLAGARTDWIEATRLGYRGSRLPENFRSLTRDLAVKLASQCDWAGTARLAPASGESEDRVLNETAAAALFHVGLESARAGRWPEAENAWLRANQLAGSRALAQNLALASEALGHWEQAAGAWREMIRRRPRKADSPDALSDGQLAALWMHVAECLLQSDTDDSVDEAIRCIVKATTFAGDDAGIRLEAGDRLAKLGEPDLAEKQFEIVMARQPDNADALDALGHLLLAHWPTEAPPILKRLLELEPDRPGLRESLGVAYAASAEYYRKLQSKRAEIEIIEGLLVSPEHPAILIALGKLRLGQGQFRDAGAAFNRAVHAAPTRARYVDEAMHELLHVPTAGAELESAFDLIRSGSQAGSEFWLSQVEQLMECRLDQAWAERFLDEAIKCAGGPGRSSRAAVIVAAYRLLDEAGVSEARLAKYAQMALDEGPDSKAIDAINAIRAFVRKDYATAYRLLVVASQDAEKRGDVLMMRELSLIEELYEPHDAPSLVGNGSAEARLVAELIRLFPDGPPTDPRMIPKGLLNELRNLFER